MQVMHSGLGYDAYPDEATNTLGESSSQAAQQAYTSAYERSNPTSSVPTDISSFLSSFMSAEANATALANKIAQQNVNNQIAATKEENRLDREFSAEQVLKQQKYNTLEREAAQKYNSAEAQLTREWQTEMDNTKYQRMVEDLRAAGINPMLAVGNGAGSTPSGATASTSAQSSSAAGTPSRGFNSAQSYKQDFSKILGTVLDYMLKSEQLDVNESQFYQNLSFQKQKLSVDSANSLLNTLIPW